MLVPQQQHCAHPCRVERAEGHGVIGEFDGDYACTDFAFTLDPARLRTVKPMNVRPAGQRVA